MGALRHPRRLLLLLAALLLVAACTDSDAASPAPTSSTTTDAPGSPAPSTPPPAATPTPPALPPEATQPTLDGAVAFTRHYFDTLNYSFETGDVDAEMALRKADCVACESSKSSALTAFANGGRTEGRLVTVTEVVPTPGDIDLGVELRVVATPEPNRLISSTGEVLKDAPGGEPFLVLVFVTWDGLGWVVESWGTSS